MKTLRCKVKKICSPIRKQETSFEYGIGVLLDGDVQSVNDNNQYCYWETEPCTYTVFRYIRDVEIV